MSPLHHASKTNQIEIARLLLKYEADPNLKGENGNTALHYAVESGHKQMTELIVGKGGSLEIENNFGVSPLELAKQSNNQSVLSAFKSKDSGAIQNKMTLTVYGFYLCITILVTIWVAKTLSKNGRIFLIDAFLGDENLADSVNRLLVVGFYLINIGYVAVSLKLGLKPLNSTDAIEILSSKIGWVILILGAMHFFNLFALSRLRRNGIAKKELQSTAGRIR